MALLFSAPKQLMVEMSAPRAYPDNDRFGAEIDSGQGQDIEALVNTFPVKIA